MIVNLPCLMFVTVNVLWLFLMVPWVGLQCVVLFPDTHHLSLEAMTMKK